MGGASCHADFAAVAALIVIFVAFAAWTATLLFLPSSPEGEILPDFIEASWQLFILLTTANYPDVMMPAYTSNRLAALFFIAFVCVGTFFLMNYQLAVVYSSYSAEEKALRAEAVARRERSLDAAFERLDWERKGALSRERARSSSTNCRARRPSAPPSSPPPSRRRRRARRWRRRSPCSARFSSRRWTLRATTRSNRGVLKPVRDPPPPLRARRPPLARRRCDRTPRAIRALAPRDARGGALVSRLRLRG